MSLTNGLTVPATSRKSAPFLRRRFRAASNVPWLFRRAIAARGLRCAPQMLGPLLVLTLSGVALATPPLTLLPSNNSFEGIVEPLPPKNIFDARPLSLELRLGIATPTGALGIALEYSFIKEFGLGCGIGSNVLGWEPACWLRGRVVATPDRALTLSTGLSESTYAQAETTRAGLFSLFNGAFAGMGESQTRALEFNPAYWSNTDFGYESRHNSFVFRAFLGAAVLLNPSSGVSPVYPSANKPAETPIALMAYGGVGFGYAPIF